MTCGGKESEQSRKGDTDEKDVTLQRPLFPKQETFRPDPEKNIRAWPVVR